MGSIDVYLGQEKLYIWSSEFLTRLISLRIQLHRTTGKIVVPCYFLSTSFFSFPAVCCTFLWLKCTYAGSVAIRSFEAMVTSYNSVWRHNPEEHSRQIWLILNMS